MAGGVTDTQGGRVLPRHIPRGGDVKVSGSNFKSIDHSLHHLPRLPPHNLVRSRHRYRHPRGQTTSAVSGLDGGGPVRNIYGSAQGA